MNQSYEYSCHLLELKDGPVYVDFDFIPDEPTYHQLRKYVKRSCDTCLHNATFDADGVGCEQDSYPKAACKLWHCHFEAMIDAEKQYWLDLHRKTMKGKPVPRGRKAKDWDTVPYLTYPDEE